MAPRNRSAAKDGEPVMSKEQIEIAKHVRFNCPTNSTMFQGNEVHYFNGAKAVDTLYESKYGTKAKGEAKFPTRASAVSFMKELMEVENMFFRARKFVAKKKEDKEKGHGDTKGERKKKKKEEEVTETEADEKKDEEKEKKTENEEKKKKKVKLEVHEVQVFNDDKDVYVWIFDPTPFFKKLIGLMMVLGVIVGCLFPLWPMWLRQGIYYLSIAGIAAFGLIVVVAILRTILFCLIWLFTGGKHKLWVLPNLTEDCGFFESFKPWYTYEYCPPGGEKKKTAKKDKKDKDSDAEEKPLVKNSKGKVKDSDDEEDDDEDRSMDDGSQGSATEVTASEVSAPPSPQGEVKKRRVRKE